MMMSEGLIVIPSYSALCGDEEMKHVTLGSLLEWGTSAFIFLGLAVAVSIACAVAQKNPETPVDEESKPAVE